MPTICLAIICKMYEQLLLKIKEFANAQFVIKSFSKIPQNG